MLTRNGYVIETSDPRQIKSELTVRPIENAVGIRPPSFKVFRTANREALVVPRYYGRERFGSPARDIRPAHARAPGIVFRGCLRDATRQPDAFNSGTRAFEEVGGGVLSLPCG